MQRPWGGSCWASMFASGRGEEGDRGKKQTGEVPLHQVQLRLRWPLTAEGHYKETPQKAPPFLSSERRWQCSAVPTRHCGQHSANLRMDADGRLSHEPGGAVLLERKRGCGEPQLQHSELGPLFPEPSPCLLCSLIHCISVMQPRESHVL